MTFADKYQSEKKWQAKILIMGLYHIAQCQRVHGWTISDTALYFHVSMSLVSENLKLHRAMDLNTNLVNMTRDEALKVIK